MTFWGVNMIFKIATWNVNSLRVRLAHVIKYLEECQLDCLALQETKVIDDDFPIDAFKAIGYDVIFTGQKTYNGVAIVARKALQEVLTQTPFIDNQQRRVISATLEGVRIINAYVPNGASLDSDKYPYKLNWLEHMRQYLSEQIRHYDKLIILGDFNIAPEDRDVHDPVAWQGQVLVSDAERNALQGLLDLGLQDSFRLHNQEDGQYSWWDYRMAAFRRNRGMRIDHILVSDSLATECRSCVIDKEPRKWERPSDHTPVIATFEL